MSAIKIIDMSKDERPYDFEEPSIVLMGNVRIDTPEDRVKAREAILRKFDAACWMYDHNRHYLVAEK